MRRKGLVCLSVFFVSVVSIGYLVRDAWADGECSAGNYVCISGSDDVSRTGTLTIQPGSTYGLYVQGTGTGADGENAPVYASQTSSTSADSFAGYFENSSTGSSYYKVGLFAEANGANGYRYGVHGKASSTAGVGYGVYGQADGGVSAYGVLAVATSATNLNNAIYANAYGSALSRGLYARAGGSSTNTAIYAIAENGTSNTAIYAEAGAGGGTAGDFVGYVAISGGLSVTSQISSDTNVIADNNLSAGNNVLAGNGFLYASERTFYYTVPAATCVDTNPNADEKVSKWSSASITAGTSPYYGYLNCPVRLPDGVTPTRVDCGVYDVDDEGQASFWMYRMIMTGTVTTLAAGVSGVAFDEGNITMYDDTLVGGAIDNYTYSYWIRVELNPSVAAQIIFYQCRITYTMEELQP